LPIKGWQWQYTKTPCKIRRNKSNKRSLKSQKHLPMRRMSNFLHLTSSTSQICVHLQFRIMKQGSKLLAALRIQRLEERAKSMSQRVISNKAVQSLVGLIPWLPRQAVTQPSTLGYDLALATWPFSASSVLLRPNQNEAAAHPRC